MGEFINSDFIQNELDEINHLQKEICRDYAAYEYFDDEEKLEHLDRLCNLLEKQSIMYARLCLSDDPDAIERKEAIQEFIEILGYDKHSVQAVFSDMKETIEEVRRELDSDL